MISVIVFMLLMGSIISLMVDFLRDDPKSESCPEDDRVEKQIN